jgi:uncharacterized membrane protein
MKTITPLLVILFMSSIIYITSLCILFKIYDNQVTIKKEIQALRLEIESKKDSKLN